MVCCSFVITAMLFLMQFVVLFAIFARYCTIYHVAYVLPPLSVCGPAIHSACCARTLQINVHMTLQVQVWVLLPACQSGQYHRYLRPTALFETPQPHSTLTTAVASQAAELLTVRSTAQWAHQKEPHP